MAKVQDERSEAVLADEFAWGHTNPTTMGIQGCERLEATPLVSLDANADITFQIHPNKQQCLNLSSTKIYLECQLTQDGNIVKEALKAEEGRVAIPVNGLMNSLFKNIEVRMQGTVISESNNLYPYRADFANRLLMDESKQNNVLDSEGYFRYEESTAFIGIKDEDLKKLKPDLTHTKLELPSGIKKRYALVRNGMKKFLLCGIIHEDVFQIDRLLPPGIGVDIICQRNDPKFYMMSRDGDHTYGIKISNAWLTMEKVTPVSEMLVSLEERRKACKIKNKPLATIPMVVSKVTYASSAAGSSTLGQNNVIQGIFPRRIAFGVVDTDNFHGTTQTDPFRYDRHMAREIIVRAQGGLLFEKQTLSYHLDEESFNSGIECVTQLQEVFKGGRDTDHCIGINCHNYEYGNVIYAFNIGRTGSLNQIGATFEQGAEGVMDIKIELIKAQTESLTTVIYAEYDGELIIDADGHCEVVLRKPPEKLQ